MDPYLNGDSPTRRTRRIVGRAEQVEHLKRNLHERGARRYIFYWGEGGVGKTRILEELIALVKESGPGYYATELIDLYHTDTHSTSDVERAIVEGLDPDRRYFANFRRARRRYEELRERGAYPVQLEERRGELRQLFVDDFNRMAQEARKLVICVDTVELLQYESSRVEQVARLDSVATRIKPWLLQILPQLHNVLVVFAGRPQPGLPKESVDRQAQLIDDMRGAFGKDFEDFELGPLDEEETGAFIRALSAKHSELIIPEAHWPVVHRLTDGRPVFIHLLVDLLLVLADEPRRIMEMLETQAHLAEEPEDSEALKAAREVFQKEILEAIFNGTGQYVWYLDLLALMPKGVDAEILHIATGLPQDEAEALLDELRPLSFIKTYKASEVLQPVQPGRVFLHDEVLNLLSANPDFITHLVYRERQVASALVRDYYDPRLAVLGQDLAQVEHPRQRAQLRLRLHRLQVERLYYLLVQDVRAGYQEYKRLSDVANWHRWVGFNTRLLDQFLQFYNDSRRRPLFEKAGITQEQITKEAVQMWAERFFWWARYDQLIDFAEYVLSPENTLLDEEDIVIMAGVAARWADVQVMKFGHRPEVAQSADALLERLPAMDQCSLEQKLARARLAAATGYQWHEAGLLNKARRYYEEAKRGFSDLPAYRIELAIWLHALAFVYGQLGRMALADPLAREALHINEELGYDYSKGLSLSALSGIECRSGRFRDAVRHGEEAMSIFEEMEDPHGITLAYRDIVHAQRRLAKRFWENRRNVEEARHILEDVCLDYVNRGIEVARKNHLHSLRDLLAEHGRVQRDLGHVIRTQRGLTEALPYYRQAESSLREVLTHRSQKDHVYADLLQDLAEILFYLRDEVGAEEAFREAEQIIGEEFLIRPGSHIPQSEPSVQSFAPLGKIELFRGEMAFARGDYLEAVRHHLLANAYFQLFSPNSQERNAMVTFLYNKMRDVPVEERRRILDQMDRWMRENRLESLVSDFLDDLSVLLR